MRGNSGYFVVQARNCLASMLDYIVMHQSIETTAPRATGHSGEFNIHSVLEDGLFPRPRGQ